MPKKKWGDRCDGTLLRDIPALNRIMPALMPHRPDNEAYINLDIDLRPLDQYLEKVNENRTEDRYTYFHLISAAIGKAFILRPRMNRFICNNRMYQRNKVSIAFTVKKKFEDKAEESLAFFEYHPQETMESYHTRIMELIHVNKREGATDPSNNAMEMLVKLPQWVISMLVSIVHRLDRHGWAPHFLVDADPNHASIFITNLGSIGLECGYHHLVKWGTNSCFVVIGKKYMKMEYDREGNGDLHMVIPVGITLDERIADGYYYSGTVALLRELLSHPELLELPADAPVEYSIKR